MTKTAQQWIQQLALEPHPEGGYYKRIYASDKDTSSNQLVRPICTSIHYLLEAGDFSAWHRIKSDEQWFFHAGTALTIYEINSTGKLIEHCLSANHELSIVIPAHSWFCATTEDAKDAYSLVSCVVSPGFVFEEFELAKAESLSLQFPEHRALIERFCRL